MKRTLLFLLGLLCLPATSTLAQSLPEHWIDGKDCEAEPAIQVHEYAKGFFILRQSLCTHFEAPFMYLIMGNEKALLLDTGASEIGLVATVDALLARWQKTHGLDTLHLTVAHTHSHSDHVFAEPAFRQRANTQVLGHTSKDVATYFGLEDWPHRSVSFALGGRDLELLPIPGHEAAHIAVYDETTATLLTGDSLYPGRLYFRQLTFAHFKASMQRLETWTRDKTINQILGAHIEMTSEAGKDYPFEIRVHDNERALPLRLDDLHRLIALLGQQKRPAVRQVSQNFVLYPLD